jgi:hypothetical protein
VKIGEKEDEKGRAVRVLYVVSIGRDKYIGAFIC